MSYTKLPFEQYFIDCSRDHNETGKARFKIDYIDVDFKYKDQLCEANYDIHYEADRNVIQLNFQESRNDDWFPNFCAFTSYYDEFNWEGKLVQLKAHDGWSYMYKQIKHQIRDKVKELYDRNKDATIEIVGWSLGSALAMFAAQDLNYNLGIKSYLYTFGSVNCWYVNDTALDYLRSCCHEVYNFVNKSDIVTYLPPFGKMLNKVKIGKFNLIKLVTEPFVQHNIYDQPYLYS